MINDPSPSRLQLHPTEDSPRNMRIKFGEANASRSSFSGADLVRSRPASVSRKVYSEGAKHSNSRKFNTESNVTLNDKVATSYSLDSLSRFLLCKNCEILHYTLLRLNRDLIDQIKELYPSPATPIREKLEDISKLESGSDEHQAYLKGLMAQVESHAIQRDNMKDSNAQRRAKLTSQHAQLNLLQVSLSDELQKVRQTHFLWLDTRRVLGLNRARLAQGLSNIFPIAQYPDDTDILCIRGNPLPKLVIVSDPASGDLPRFACLSISFWCRPESKHCHNAALGDTASLVHNLARYLDVELPYPLLLSGSTSMIIHPTALAGDDLRRYPLFETNDTSECTMAMNLLNRDIVLVIFSSFISS
ncbi:hypothetical protein DSO57_1007724 [Entomophthora muscae]|uniref:Uncharacterized protein n=1 Tax=Entomophthora muscae TaxID=34485 RepID=A0ACC2TI02_9FUNG|nr:hypothetical protein DSO57_1007724 [Entomophthora muscae]